MVSREKRPDRGLRLDAYVARAGLASRKEARGLIRRGAIFVDDVVCRDAQQRITTERVRLGEQEVDSPAEALHLVLHKPIGLACSHDEQEAPLVFELLSAAALRRSPRIAGRLDRATSGLVILTTEGDFVHRLTHPTRKVPKRYRIEYEGELAPDAVERCREGFLLGQEEKPTRPAELVVEAPGQATIWLREGRTHQVRRMIRTLGAEVTSLHRDRMGRFDLPADLAPGDFRPLAPEERALLLSESSL